MAERAGHRYETNRKETKKKRRWLEKEVKLISEREWDEQFEDETDCPLCCVITKWVLVIILFCFFLVIPSVMIYVGVAYRYCGILCYLDFLVLIAKFPLKHYFGVDTVDVYYVFLFWLLIIMTWWVAGFGRIFSGAINTEPFMGDSDCKRYLYTFPFWLCLSPFLIFFFISFIFCCHNC